MHSDDTMSDPFCKSTINYYAKYLKKVA
jgi:hypothetical protein